MKDYLVWKACLDWLNHDLDPKIILIAAISGSSPGKPGFKMVVNKRKEFQGTVGGAIMEANFIRGYENLPIAPSVRKLVHNPKAPPDKKSGLNCAGTQHTLFYKLKEEDIPLLENLLALYSKESYGILTIDPNGIKLEECQLSEGKVMELVHSPKFEISSENWRYQEVVGLPHTIYIFGGGHTGIALSRIMKSLHFKVIVIDDRPDLEMHLSNPYADEVIVADFYEYASKLPENPRTYAVACTYSKLNDTKVVKGALRKNIPFLGLMGSKAKISMIWKDLLSFGFSEEELKRVIAPVGLPINDETVEEIAISIAAQIIQTKNSHKIRDSFH